MLAIAGGIICAVLGFYALVGLFSLGAFIFHKFVSGPNHPFD
jgi:hypothetical protein